MKTYFIVFFPRSLIIKLLLLKRKEFIGSGSCRRAVKYINRSSCIYIYIYIYWKLKTPWIERNSLVSCNGTYLEACDAILQCVSASSSSSSGQCRTPNKLLSYKYCLFYIIRLWSCLNYVRLVLLNYFSYL